MMQIYSVREEEFRSYGKLIEGLDTGELTKKMMEIPLPEKGTAYAPSVEKLESCGIAGDFEDRVYGGMPVQIGMCWGRNSRLNCLEYHRDSEINIGTQDYILLLAREEEIRDGKLDTGCVKAFYVPAGVPVEVFATTLHYAPCHTDRETGFRVAVVLPRGTNTEKPEFVPACDEDRMLRARNKWLLAHPDSPEAADGAWIGLTGENIDIEREGV